MPDTSSGELRAERFFASALRHFHELAESPGAAVSRQISLAGRTIRLEVSAGAMERLMMPALAHLDDQGRCEPDLMLYAWDSESTGAPWLKPGWSIEKYRRDGSISGFNNQHLYTAVQFDPLVVRMLDMQRRRALYWTPSAAKLPYWEMAAPMRPLLHEWLRRLGLSAAHGGAVGREDGGVFLAGPGGRGKSNVALACLNSELRYASDDFCFLSQSPLWRVHSLYCTGKIAVSDLARHPHLHDLKDNFTPPGEKLIFFLHDKFRDRLIREMPLRAVVLPRVVAQGSSKIVPISSAEAERVIALSTIELLRWAGRDSLIKAKELVRDLPCYELQIGASIAEIPVLLDGLLTDLRQQRSPLVYS